MYAIDHPGPAAEDLTLVECERPEPGAHEVLIKVHAAGINRPDILQRQGRYPPPEGASPRLGLEVAGEIVAIGAKVQNWQLGECVCALTDGGGYGEYCVVPEGQLMPVPKGLSMVQAAALPEAMYTVWYNLFMQGLWSAGERVLIHGGSGGIGTMAVQLAKALGLQVITTAGSYEKCERLRTLGADCAINYRDEDFVTPVRELGGAHIILDMVGGGYIERNIKAAIKGGRIVQIAFMQGSRVELDLMPIMLKRLTLTGSTMRSQTAEVKALIAKQLVQTVWPLVVAGQVAPAIDSIFPLKDAQLAHQRMESSEHFGKLVLQVSQ